MQLIDLIKENYQQLENGVKKNAFLEIAKKINIKNNLNLSYEQIDSKWKGLKKTYKKIKEENNSTGQSRKTWEFYDAMNELLHRAPEINPPATLSTEEECVVLSHSENDENIPDEYSYSTNFRKRRRSNAGSEREANIERRHQERMEATSKFLDLFQKMVDKM